ncbi:hypothetical protein [Paraburkholderia sp. J8-2]|uniref:hypothetical protein n=1 Tax=Paraburkholderia sp. J8-2 TaxID=2805440 RepID=UPI002AB6C50A|nr:hypothetical protein [Paraburkholderia sp. J8-2]
MRDPGGVEDAAYIMQLEERIKNEGILKDMVERFSAAHAEQMQLRSEIGSVASLLAAVPTDIQAVIDKADVIEIHRMLARALETDFWSRLTDHTDTESRGLKAFMVETKESVRLEVAELRDAVAGKPALPIAPPGSSRWRRAFIATQRAALRSVRACATFWPVFLVATTIAVTLFAAVAVALLYATLQHVCT